MKPAANTQLISPIEAHCKQYKQLIAMGGPEPADYPKLEKFLESVYLLYQSGVYTDADIHRLNLQMPREGMENTLQGFAYLKPHGYAGDYEIIDKIYRRETSKISQYANWDRFFHAQAAPKAVRNRKDYFKNILRQYQEKGSVKILNIASGPCRGLKEFLEEVGEVPFEIHCLDADANAISYAKEILGPYARDIRFIHKNLFRFQADEQYDLVWSAGLFDYFDDPTFVRLLKRMRSWVRPDGELIIGNFSTNNPSIPYMLFGQWVLNYRSEAHLQQLFEEAGYPADAIKIEAEAEGVNLFVRGRI